MTTQVTETKAQRVERLKREKNPWEGLEEIRSFSRQGFNSIPPEWLGTWMGGWGVSERGGAAGLVGGKMGEARPCPFLRVCTRIPGVWLTPGWFSYIARGAGRLGRGTADLTVRQNIQLHWVTI